MKGEHRQGSLSPAIETRIALFLCATRAVDLPLLSISGLDPRANPAWQALIDRLFPQSAPMSALMRATRWRSDPRLYWQNLSLVGPLYSEFACCGIAPAALVRPDARLEAMALAQAILTVVRPARLLPATRPAEGAFPQALLRIEQETARLAEAQARMMEDAFGHVPQKTRTDLVAAKSALVQSVQAAFLDALRSPA